METKKNVARITDLVTKVDQNECFLGAVCPPVFDTTIFCLKDFEMAEMQSSGEINRYTYSRTDGNPTYTVLNRLLADMENGEAAQVFASGTTAIYTAMVSCLRAGSHVIIDRNAYGRPIGLLRDVFSRFGVDYTFVSTQHLDEVEAAIKPNTVLFYLESPTSWLFQVSDLRALAELAQRHGIKTIIDNTYATPVYQNPLDFGIDIVVHSATKYLGGHSNTTGGVIISDQSFIDHLTQVEGKLSTQESAKLLLNLRTLPLRMERHYENAKQVAAYLEKSEKIASLSYPGSPNYPQAALVEKQMYGASGLMSFVLDCDRAGCKRFIDAMDQIHIGGSWGSYESVIWAADFVRGFRENPEFTTIKPHQCRLSVGIEHIDMLLSQMEKGLRAI